MKDTILLETEQLHKAFGPTIALKSVNIQIKRGEIRGLIGENGSGKSTIMSIASGMNQATSGTMRYKGKPWNPKNMIEASKDGIAMILQEANTIPHVTVAQNIFAGREAEFSMFGIIRMRKMIKAADQLLKIHGVDHIKAEHNIDRYNFEDRKLIEIVRAISLEVDILVVDETTTALSLEGRNKLYKIIRKMADEHKAVILISHDMEEILERCDALTVLRDGDIIGHLNKEEMQSLQAEKNIRFMMVGREIGDKYYRDDYDHTCEDTVALEINQVSSGRISDFSLKVHKGEIVGIGGLSGSGMHDIGRIAFGLDKVIQGEILCNKEPIQNSLMAIKNGVGYISKNRDTEALILTGSIKDNICLPSLKDIEKRTFIHPKFENEIANKEIDAFRIKCNDKDQLVNTLSGGNKQKVSFSKWTAKGSDVIIMDSPTRGVDIGVKQAMYRLIEEMKRQGKAILMISEELPELIGMSDRLLIMKDYKIVAEFERSPNLKETDIIEFMI